MSSPLPLHLLLRDDAHAPETRLCHDGHDWVTWRQFSRRLHQRHALFAPQEEARWLIDQADPLAFLIDLLALLAAGKVVVIPPNAQSGTIERLSHAWDAITPAHALGCNSGEPSAPLRLDAAAALIHIYTSGSTGEPKAVVKSLQQFETEIQVLERVWGTDLGTAPVVSTAPHHHFYGLLFRLLWPLASGRVFDTVTCSEPETLTRRLHFFGRSILVSSPAQLSRLPDLTNPKTLAPLLRRVFSSGGPLPAEAALALAQGWGRAPTEVFGSTETGGIAWRERQDSDDAWTPFPDVGITAGPDTALHLHSPLLDDASAYVMEDAIQQLPDGRFRLLGRLDRVVKIEEKRVSLPDVENRLRAHDWVGDAAAVALTGRRQALGAAIVLNAAGRTRLQEQGPAAAARELRQHLARHFDAVVLPRRWRFVDGLPLNERGKLTQASLQALFDRTGDLHASA